MLPSNVEQREARYNTCTKEGNLRCWQSGPSCSEVGWGGAGVSNWKRGLEGLYWSCSFLIYVLLNKYVQFANIFVCCFYVHFPICRLYARFLCVC